MADELSPEAKEFFRKHGKQGGKKRTDAMTKKERTELARKAANARWAKKGKKK